MLSPLSLPAAARSEGNDSPTRNRPGGLSWFPGRAHRPDLALPAGWRAAMVPTDGSMDGSCLPAA